MSLSGLRVAVIVFPGSNCDRDMMVAIEQLAGRRPSLVWHKETTLDPVDLAIIPGGFSYGCLLYTSPSPRDGLLSRMPSSA